ncbi:MAG TPA: O-antigen ligase family protein [Bacteroidetes bacterium]|nr:O-antigen ligase family protein [Bacteroidota bacterium]
MNTSAISTSNMLIFSLLLFIMPINPKILPIIIALSLIIYLLDSLIHSPLIFSDKKTALTGLAFFVIHIASVYNSDNKEVAWFDIEVKLSFLFVPLIFFIKNHTFHKNKKVFIYSFISGALISSIIMLCKGYDNSHTMGIEGFRYTNISLFHPTYMAMYLSLATVFLFKEVFILPYKKRWVPVVIILILSFMIFLLESKAGMIIYCLTLFLMTWILYLKFKPIAYKSTAILAFLTIGLLFYSGSQRAQFMFENIHKTILSGHIVKDATTGDRLKVWHTSLEIISNNYLLGVGSGDVKKHLISGYKEHGYRYAIKKSLNSHNQYLETFIGQGIFGFILLIYLFIIAYFKAHKNKDFVLSFFILITSINFLFESMLNTMAGVIFFSLFYFLLMNYSDNNHLKEKT